MACFRLSILCAVSLLVVVGPLGCVSAYAQGAKDGSRSRKTYTTFGLRKCSDWNKNIADEKAISPNFGSGIAAVVDRSWLAGFVSGINMALTDREDLLSGMDLQTASDWVDAYCKKNKTSDVAEAVSHLYVELVKMRKQK